LFELAEMPRLQRAFTKKYRINLTRAEFGFINKINKEGVADRWASPGRPLAKASRRFNNQIC
jgi:hypothetical protein